MAKPERQQILADFFWSWPLRDVQAISPAYTKRNYLPFLSMPFTRRWRTSEAFLTAHNAGFDRPFCEKISKTLSLIPWF
ncbi:hypothetical protein, partial [Asticcacaulis benevestitus]|uniref:hypothetical protein n=1 Tax=Asticcacaulis benevestitus TaxID=347481 RepID=UPI001F3D0451